MRILLSAFACDPTQGSEEGVGWAWAYHLAKAGHEVVVLTRNLHHRQAIDVELRKLEIPNLRIEYIGVRFCPFCIPGLSVYPYYFCWQWMAYFHAKRLHKDTRFDIVHHVTYGLFRSPSYLYLLNAPFIFGPVGGGECAPRALRMSLSAKGKIVEALRLLANVIPYFDPFWRSMLRHSARIAVRTEETRRCLPRNTTERTVLALENMVAEQPFLAGETERIPPLKLLYAGRLLAWKGIHLAIRAVALLDNQVPVELTIAGKGPEEARLKDEVRRLELEESIHFLPWMPRAEVPGLYATHDALLFPSLHDSGGTVVMEATWHGRPVICLDLGGPAVTVDKDCARIVSTNGKTEEQVIRGIADAILELARMPSNEWDEMRRAAIRRAEFYLPDRVIGRVYGSLLRPCRIPE